MLEKMRRYPLNCPFNLSYQLPASAAKKISGLEVLFEFSFVEKMRTLQNKKGPQILFFIIPLTPENKFNLFDSISLKTLRFKISRHQKKDEWSKSGPHTT